LINEPLYIQVMQSIKKIENSKWEEGELIPPEKELMKE
jgi:DNA-binding GntR family transcriptional regulator